MNESKELLEATVKGLEEKISQLQDDLMMKNKELEDVSKSEMTDEMYDELHGLVEEGVSKFDFTDSNNYEIEYEIDYDGRVNASSIELNDTHNLVESIMNKIDKAYKILDTEVTNATHVEKVI
jgi:transcriptional regulator CtsR